MNRPFGRSRPESVGRLPDLLPELYNDGQMLMPGAVVDVINQDRRGKWFERSFYADANKPVLAHIVENLPPLAEYASEFHGFFVITVQEDGLGKDKWTFMPASLDGRYKAKAAYAARLIQSHTHIIVDPGISVEKLYTDDSQLGLNDNVCGHGHTAYDVSADEGIRWDTYARGRDRLTITEGGWVDITGRGSNPGNFDYTGPAVQTQQIESTSLQALARATVATLIDRLPLP